MQYLSGFPAGGKADHSGLEPDNTHMKLIKNNIGIIYIGISIPYHEEKTLSRSRSL